MASKLDFFIGAVGAAVAAGEAEALGGAGVGALRFFAGGELDVEGVRIGVGVGDFLGGEGF